MFDTLDIILSFVIIIFILSLIAESVQSILKRILNSKTKQAIDGIREIVKTVTDTDIAKKELVGLKKRFRVSDLMVDNMRVIVEEMGNLDVVKQGLSNKSLSIDALESKLDAEIENLKEKYITHMRQVSVIVALILCTVLNADSLQMVEKISSDKAVRQMIIQSEYIQKKLGTEERTEKKAPGPAEEKEAIKKDLASISDIVGEYQGLNIGIKWGSTKRDFLDLKDSTQQIFFIIKKMVGIMITVALVSMGAPFWHDTLETLFGLKNKLRKG